MAPPTVQTLQRLAAETGYRLDTLEKVLRLLELLDEIAEDPVLSQRLALKGGTALNVFYLDLDRLSVDIDLNYVGALDLAVMERERPEVDAAIDRLFASHGYGCPPPADRARRRQSRELWSGGQVRHRVLRPADRRPESQRDSTGHVGTGGACGSTCTSCAHDAGPSVGHAKIASGPFIPGNRNRWRCRHTQERRSSMDFLRSSPFGSRELGLVPAWERMFLTM